MIQINSTLKLEHLHILTYNPTPISFPFTFFQFHHEYVRRCLLKIKWNWWWWI